jgi:hyaluronoglucosaminidase
VSRLPCGIIKTTALKQVPPTIGVIEGFFGKTWSDAARLAVLGGSKPFGFDHYIYAPKADAYLRRRWREPMPAEPFERLALLAGSMRAQGIKFGVGFTPFEVHRDYTAKARSALKEKVAQLDEIGIDIFCILFDDMRGGTDLAERQARLVDDIATSSSAGHFRVCPTLYSDDPILPKVFGPTPENYLEDLGRLLDPGIDIFWTGQKVCSSAYPDAHLAHVTERLGRKPFIWDNSIANDGKVRCSHLYLSPTLSGWSVNPSLVSGVAINPMNQPFLSALPLRAFGALFAQQAAPDFYALAAALCGKQMAVRLDADLQDFQRRGIAALAAAELNSRIEEYELFGADTCAREITAWLRGEYQFDPTCLTE